jgi:membrane-bound metal-dependent hydrolase YbcI (DUF457 family)
MPVIGHAFVGLGTGLQFEPAARRDRQPPSPLTRALWLPAVVAVSYVPDIVTQLGSMAGLAHANLAGHSLIVALAGGLGIAALWAAMTGLSFPRLLAISIGSILGHDLLDLLQTTDRAPFWPWSTHIVSVGAILPRRTLIEGPLFLLLFVLYVLWRMRTGRSLELLRALVDLRPRAASAAVWAARAAVVAILLTATGTHALRAERERAAREAGLLNAQGRYEDALRVVDTADRWPWPARPGRLDIIRGEAHEALGQPATAERYFLQAYREDPTNFWAVADLAEFYAARDAPPDDRRRLTQLYTDELRRRFPRHEHLHDVLARVDRKLNAI